MKTYAVLNGIWNDSPLSYMVQEVPYVTGENISQALNSFVGGSRPYKWKDVSQKFIEKHCPSFWLEVQDTRSNKIHYIVPKYMYYGNIIMVENGCRC